MTPLMLNGIYLCLPTLYLLILLVDQPVAPEEMTWQYRLMAMAVGGVASLFALHFSKPKSHQEAMVRFAAGCVVAFTMTGPILYFCHLPINIDSVLAAALVWGSVGWWVLGGLVAWGQSGGPLSYLAQFVQGKQNINFTQEQIDKIQSAPTSVKEVKPIKE